MSQLSERSLIGVHAADNRREFFATLKCSEVSVLYTHTHAHAVIALMYHLCLVETKARHILTGARLA